MILAIEHITTYRYATEVTLGPHRLMLRPRGGPDLRVVGSSISCTPAASLAWTQDVFGNLIATAAFHEPASRLTITGKLSVELCADEWPIFQIAPSAHRFPFAYDDDDAAALGALRTPSSPSGARLPEWVAQLRSGCAADTLTLLKAINHQVGRAIRYRAREEEGTQTADETLRLGTGSCRDMATLFIDAVRLLGFGARAVSGYVYFPGSVAQANGDTTHAWAEVFLPGAGWIAFDPTNDRMGGANLIPIATARRVGQIMPVQGSFSGPPDALVELSVGVHISARNAAPEGASPNGRFPLFSSRAGATDWRGSPAS